jgi:uncharacterized protein YndB with AHSA1/START domain
MKWILYVLAGVLGLVVVAVVVLLALGGARGQGRLVETVEIAQPAAVVFKWITEPPRLKSWIGWLVDIQMLTPEVGRVGSKHVWVMEDRNNNNQRMDIAVETTRVEPDRLLEVQLNVPSGFTGTVTYELQPMDQKRTLLMYRGTYQYQHWLAKLLEPVISRSAQQKLEEDLQRLKQLAEAEQSRGEG